VATAYVKRGVEPDETEVSAMRTQSCGLLVAATALVLVTLVLVTVRVLLPSLREAVAKTLGTPFFAAVPTRGRLLLWSASSSPRLQEHMRKVVRQGFMNGPYPLSPSTFSVAGTTVTEEQ
jgi:hypothetical protein